MVVKRDEDSAGSRTVNWTPFGPKMTVDWGGSYQPDAVPTTQEFQGLEWYIEESEEQYAFLENDQPIPLSLADTEFPKWDTTARYDLDLGKDTYQKYSANSYLEPFIGKLTEKATAPDTSTDLDKIHQRINWWVRNAYGGSWHSDDSAGPGSLGDLQAGKPLMLLLNAGLANIKDWSGYIQFLHSLQLGLDITQETPALVNLADIEVPKQIADIFETLDVMAVTRNRYRKFDLRTIGIKALFYKADGSVDTKQGGGFGVDGPRFPFLVDQIRQNENAARAAIALQRQRLINERHRLTVEFAPWEQDDTPPISLYETFQLADVHWRIMDIQATWGEDYSTGQLLCSKVRDVDAED